MKAGSQVDQVNSSQLKSTWAFQAKSNGICQRYHKNKSDDIFLRYSVLYKAQNKKFKKMFHVISHYPVHVVQS